MTTDNVLWTGNALPVLIAFVVLVGICIVVCILDFVTIKISVGGATAAWVIGILSICSIVYFSIKLFNDQEYHILSIEPVTNSTAIGDDKVQFSEYIVCVRENDDIIYKFAVSNENIEWFKEKGSERFSSDRFDLNERIVCKLNGHTIDRNYETDN